MKTKNKMVAVYLKPELHEMLSKHTDSVGLKNATWVRQLVVLELKRISEESEKTDRSK